MGGVGAETLTVAALKRRDVRAVSTSYHTTAPPKIGGTHCLGHVETWSGDEKYSGLLELSVLGSIAWHIGSGVSTCCTNINELLWSIFTMLHWCIELVLQYWTIRLCLRTIFTNKTQEKGGTFIYQMDRNGILCHIIQAGIWQRHLF